MDPVASFVPFVIVVLAVISLFSWILKGGLAERAATSPQGELGDSKIAEIVPELKLRPPILLGHSPGGEMLKYDGEGHLLTIGHTRSGKGVGSIIPNLLEYTGSIIIFDPKGENTLATINRRKEINRDIYVIDPWNVTGHNNCTFNPLIIADDSTDLAIEDAKLIADAIVAPGNAGEGQHFWEEEARNLIATLILAISLDAGSTSSFRKWSFLREIIGDSTKLEMFLNSLLLSPFGRGALARGASQFLDKVPNERSGVLSTARQHTAFLDSPDIIASLEMSDFRFEKARERPTTVYIVMPTWRLPTYGRWLRILVSMAVTEMSRAAGPSKTPVLFILDEFASIGQLQSFDIAYSLLAGYGVQLWPIFQDFNQISKIYGEYWQTFVANAAVLQSFGTRDLQTAKYLSERVGNTTISLYEKSASDGNEGRNTLSSRLTQRALLLPDEITRLDTSIGLVFVENSLPVKFKKIRYFAEDRFKKVARIP